MKDKRTELPDGNMFKHYSPEKKTPIPEGALSMISFKTAEDFERERRERRALSK